MGIAQQLGLTHDQFVVKPLMIMMVCYVYISSSNGIHQGLTIFQPHVMHVRAHLRPGTYHVLVLMELRWICRTGTQGDRSLLNALSRKCYMRTLQYVHRGTLP